MPLGWRWWVGGGVVGGGGGKEAPLTWTLGSGAEPSSTNCPPRSTARYAACLMRCTPFCGVRRETTATMSLSFQPERFMRLRSSLRAACLPCRGERREEREHAQAHKRESGGWGPMVKRRVESRRGTRELALRRWGREAHGAPRRPSPSGWAPAGSGCSQGPRCRSRCRCGCRRTCARAGR